MKNNFISKNITFRGIVLLNTSTVLLLGSPNGSLLKLEPAKASNLLKKLQVVSGRKYDWYNLEGIGCFPISPEIARKIPISKLEKAVSVKDFIGILEAI